MMLDWFLWGVTILAAVAALVLAIWGEGKTEKDWFDD
jgi:hypothetical protein